jgi:hypothetical protein
MGTRRIGSPAFSMRERVFARRLVVEIAAGAAKLPLEVVEFLAWIVLVTQRRQAAAG